MPIAAVIASVLAASQPMDLDDLTLAADRARRKRLTEAEVTALDGRRFAFSLPIISEYDIDVRRLQLPATWNYSRKRKTLTVHMGVGSITEQNYDRYRDQNLHAAPMLQTAFFSVREIVYEMGMQGAIGAVGLNGGGSIESQTGPALPVGLTNSQFRPTQSFALAVPSERGGPPGLPSGFPLSATETFPVEDYEARKTARSLRLEVSGELTTVDGAPAVFCGRYTGRWKLNLTPYATTAADGTPNLFKINQCFLTARIERIAITGGGRTLKHWG